MVLFEIEKALAMVVDYMGYIWLFVAILFLFAELNTPGLFFFISFTFGAFLAAIVAFLGYSFIMQCVVGLISTVVVFLFVRKYLKRAGMSDVSHGSSVSNVDALVGKEAIVLVEITPNERGLVKIEGESWRARANDMKPLLVGALVKVLRVEGNTVVVRSLSKEE